jgi:uncharacterized small protein (DUF1192 family)
MGKFEDSIDRALAVYRLLAQHSLHFRKHHRKSIVLESDDLGLTPNKKPKDLDRLSIEELETYIADLKQEISRVEAKIISKRNQQGVADSLFRLS